MNFFKSGASQKMKKTLFLLIIGLGFLIISDLSFGFGCHLLLSTRAIFSRTGEI